MKPKQKLVMHGQASYQAYLDQMWRASECEPKSFSDPNNEPLPGFQWWATQLGSALWWVIDISSSSPQYGDCLCISHFQQLSESWQASICICFAMTSSRLLGTAGLLLTFYCTDHCELTLTILHLPSLHTQTQRNTNMHYSTESRNSWCG